MCGIGASGFCDQAAIYYLLTNLLMFIILTAGSMPVVHELFKIMVFRPKRKRIRIAVVIYILMFLMSVAYLVTSTYSPFLYFQF